ncbi:MAG: tRNA (N(6)-L-threonylcarbamoyladenosine(37)-C(2))-methylthiotransferase MtaB [Rickettsiales bacterium]|jgi:threonylcarbamoyladenosine tRNA methylthiotransferase MtaB|nr:tRNA (N(6)-L-threonylcarbamoyladenosine(37)-C(2))-methylthiotransferase MtaB [Rickettsiales bacterium]
MLDIKTFGCRLNFFESEVIRKFLAPLCQNKKWCVFNSCAITQEAYRQLKQQIRKYKRENEDAKVFVTGCSAQIEFEELSKMPEIFKVIDNKNKLDVNAYLNDERVVASDFGMKETQALPCKNQVPEKFVMHTKAFVQIQQGCNNFCTYCIVPYTRGRSVSFDKDLIFKQFQTFLNNGYKELTITGVDIASYGIDNNRLDSCLRRNNACGLTGLLREILEKFKGYDFRIRLSSIDPAYSDFDGIFQLMKENKKLTPFLHLSMQSGDDVVLKSMNRKHTANDLHALINKGRKMVPNIAYGSDLICGFAGETDKLFENTYNVINELEIEHLHVFPYSVRPKTGASHLGDTVAKQIKKDRVNKILELNKNYLSKKMQNMLGQTREILSEGKWGYTDNYFKVLLDDEDSKGKIITKKLTTISKDGNEFHFITD